MFGFGDLLRVDLSTETIRREAIPLEMRRRYLGGGGINGRLLWEHFLDVDPKVDPRGPDNVLIVGLGPLGGTPFGFGSKTKFTFKSPAYGLFGDSVSGAGFGPAMRWAGFDHLVVTGKAKHPVYLWIDDGRVELRDARHLWGKNALEAEHVIKRELHDEEVHTALIGRAGENLVGYASITVGGHRAAGRTGGGCVMGSKNLKALVARGRKGLPVANAAAFLAAMDEVQRRIDKLPVVIDNWRRLGTLRSVDFYDLIHCNAYKNGQLSAMPKEANAKLNAAAYVKDLIDHAVSCSPGCSTACSAWQRIRGFESAAAKHFVGEQGPKPEYLTIASLGVGTDVRDLPAVIHLNRLCFDYGLDLVEMGNGISFLMECWEKGIVSAADLESWLGEPANLDWGNWEVAAKVIEAVGNQSNELGRMLKDNVVGAARRLEERTGQAALKYVNYGKGGATFSEDPRPFPGWACNMAVASRGADHLKGMAPVEKGGRKDISTAWFGHPEAGELHGVALKGALSARAENVNCATNATGVCSFIPTRDSLVFGHDLLAAGVSALSGISFSEDDLYNIGERICNIEKAFNSRLGLRRSDDTLCDRWMNVPAPDGPGKGMKVADCLEQVLDEYYEHKGWDKATGLQRRAKLVELGLDDVADVLAAENALVD